MQTMTAERDRLARLRASVDVALDRRLPPAQAGRLAAAMRHLTLAPGKRLRPVLVLLIAEHLGGTSEAAMPAACALEYVHAASLVLDDLPCMDDAPMRRGQASVHVAFGEDVAVLTGVALLNEAYGVVTRATHLPPATRLGMLEALVRAVGFSGLVAGQEEDLKRDAERSLNAIAAVHHQKTGVLFVAAAEMGALAAGADARTTEALRGFAYEFGLAFQALDDLDDLPDPNGAGAAAGGPSAHILSVLGREEARARAEAQAREARATLRRASPSLASLGSYIDLLLGRS